MAEQQEWANLLAEIFEKLTQKHGDNNFRGFFSISPMVIRKTIENICTTLKVDIGLAK